MTTKTYNTTLRDFVNFANAMNRMFDTPYDYARNGGSTNSNRENADALRLTFYVWAAV